MNIPSPVAFVIGAIAMLLILLPELISEKKIKGDGELISQKKE